MIHQGNLDQILITAVIMTRKLFQTLNPDQSIDQSVKRAPSALLNCQVREWSQASSVVYPSTTPQTAHTSKQTVKCSDVAVKNQFFVMFDFILKSYFLSACSTARTSRNLNCIVVLLLLLYCWKFSEKSPCKPFQGINRLV